MRKISILAASALAITATLGAPMITQAASCGQGQVKVIVANANNNNCNTQEIKDKLAQYGINLDTVVNNIINTSNFSNCPPQTSNNAGKNTQPGNSGTNGNVNQNCTPGTNVNQNGDPGTNSNVNQNCAPGTNSNVNRNCSPETNSNQNCNPGTNGNGNQNGNPGTDSNDNQNCNPGTTAPSATATPVKPTTPAQPATPAPTATPVKPATPAPTPTPSATPESDKSETSFQNQVIKLVNEERAKAGLSALTPDTTVQSAAQVRAQESAASFSHTRPNGKSFSTALTEAGVNYRGSGENIAWGQKTPAEVMTGWMNSAGHKANILNPNFTKIGVGYYQNGNGVNYWSQLFIY